MHMSVCRTLVISTFCHCALVSCVVSCEVQWTQPLSQIQSAHTNDKKSELIIRRKKSTMLDV